MKTIQFKVMAEHQSNDIINEVTPKLNALFEGLKGNQILKVGADVCNGSILKKHKDKMDLIIKEVENKYRNDDIYTNIFIKVCCYSVHIEVKLRFNTLNETGFIYYENQKYLLSIKDLHLDHIYPFNHIEHISEEEQTETFNKCNSLKKELNKELGKLRPYGLRDLVD
ncbi:MAG: hypothetical protein ACTSQH_00085 [Candidatus Hodarchaeales archaeon]